MVVTRKLNKVKGDRDIEEALTKILIDFDTMIRSQTLTFRVKVSVVLTQKKVISVLELLHFLINGSQENHKYVCIIIVIIKESSVN